MKYLIAIILSLSATCAHSELTCCRNGAQVVCESPYEQRVADEAYQEMLVLEWRWMVMHKDDPERRETERLYDEALKRYERMLLSVDRCEK